MANMMDYLDWRGDIPFSADPFNEIDNIILAELAYVDFGGIVYGPDLRQHISLQEACGRFFEIYTEDEIMDKNSSTKVAPFLMRKMAQTRRYQNLELSGYVNTVDNEFQSQFSVVTCFLEDGTIYVAFRGTDNTIVGWKEDFNMSFLDQTHGQMQAVAYLEQNFRHGRQKIRVGGHSKGGNFAVYASAFCQKNVQNRIMEIYSNDGPGFRHQVMDTEGYRSITDRVKSYIPQSSIVGMLLENDLEHQVIMSSQIGAMQHDLMSWQVLGNHFVVAENVKESSVALDKTLKNWIYGLSSEEREEFVNTLFDALQSTGATTLDELSGNKLDALNTITKTMSELPKEKQQAFVDVLVRFAYSGFQNMKKDNFQKMRKKEKIEDIGSIE